MCCTRVIYRSRWDTLSGNVMSGMASLWHGPPAVQRAIATATNLIMVLRLFPRNSSSSTKYAHFCEIPRNPWFSVNFDAFSNCILTVFGLVSIRFCTEYVVLWVGATLCAYTVNFLLTEQILLWMWTPENSMTYISMFIHHGSIKKENSLTKS